MRILLLFIFLFINFEVFSQYVMSNQTVYDCEGILTDSEANTLNPGWYTNNENFTFTICPQGVSSIVIDFITFMTEPNNDYVIVYSGPDTTYPVLAGPYSGINLPPQITTSGCVTIQFVSDINVTSDGFELHWFSQISAPNPPNISIPVAPTCSTTVINLELDMNLHCDSVSTAQISLDGSINQTLIANPINCINDSTNSIQLVLNPGLNESGVYDINLESYFLDECDSLWNLSTNYQFVIDDCPLVVDIVLSEDSAICFGECIDIYANVSGGDSNSYNFFWNPPLPNSAGPHTVCPNVNTIYTVLVSDFGPATDQVDSVEIIVNPLPVLQPPFSICQTESPINLIANPVGGIWNGSGIVDNLSGLFNPSILPSGNNIVTYDFLGCEQTLDINVLDIFAGKDISVCVGAQNFNLNTTLTTNGGLWSGSVYIQSNGDFIVPNSPMTIQAIYTLPNNCSDTLELSVVNSITMPASTTYCQKSGYYNFTVQPANGVWNTLPVNPQSTSLCPNSIDDFPYEQGWEGGLNGWTNDINNDFDWIVSSGPTPSSGTGPNSAYEGLEYIYTESSNPNNPSKRASLISPCFNLSEYDNPVLHFWFHKYGNGQGSLAVDISTNNGTTWNWNYWDVYGDLGDQWNQIAIDLSMFNSSEVLIRLRVITGNNFKSDIAIDKLSVLSGPITSDGIFISNVAASGTQVLTYSIEGCSENLVIQVDEVDAGVDYIVCPVEIPFNLSGSPANGIWSGSGIINNNLGTFDPSINLGSNIVTYEMGTCIDTAIVNVVDTDVQIDSITFCVNNGPVDLDMNFMPRQPWNGTWSGNGITNSNFPGTFNPQSAGSGIHIINYEANTCSDNLVINVLPSSQLFDTLICSTSNDLILNVLPSGGYWEGNGIIDNNNGLFSPSQLGVGVHYVRYTTIDNCIDTFAIEIYDPPTLSLFGLESSYCYKDTLIEVTTTPSLGGVLSGPGVNGSYFNPSVAGNGYHIISFSYGLGSCYQSIDVQVFVSEKINVLTYSNEDTLCPGELAVIGASASGGNGTYFFNWNNNLSNSFEHIVLPQQSFTNYIVNVSDNCSDNVIDTIPIFVYPTFDLNFSVSSKKCFGEKGYAIVSTNTNDSYSYLWDNGIKSDSIYDFVNKTYNVKVTDNTTMCLIEDTITIPGYERIYAYFTPNPTSCISVLDNNIQFINNSIVSENDLSISSHWDFGDGTIINYNHLISPSHAYLDTGNFEVKLYLENLAGCSDSLTNNVCVLAENKIYIPNSFTPNYDRCNDEFYIKGLGGFKDFSIKIFNRWGNCVFESNEVIITNNSEDNNNCNSFNNLDEYYKMGSWDGVTINGNIAPTGIYSYTVKYKQLSSSKIIEKKGVISLIR